MEDLFYNFPDYTIATEGISISDIKSHITKLIKMICDAMQQLSSWIASKFCRFFNIDMITVNQDYYNEIMNVISMVSNIDLPLLSKIDVSIKVLRNDTNEVKRIYGELQKKVDELRLIADNTEKIIPSKYGKTIQISTTKLKHLKLTFSKMQSDATSQICKLKSLKNDPDNIEWLKYTQTQITMIGHMATINCMKSNICIRLLDKLMKNAMENNKKTEYKYWEEANMNNYSLESFISFCDNMMIVEEGFSEYKKIYKNHKKDIAVLDKEYNLIPTDTIENVDKKMLILENILKQTNDALKYMGQVKPNAFDKFVNALAIAADGLVGTTATLKVRNDIGKFDVGIPEVHHKLKNIAFLIASVASIHIITTKGTLSGRNINRKELCENIDISRQKYLKEYYMLTNKKKELEKNATTE